MPLAMKQHMSSLNKGHRLGGRRRGPPTHSNTTRPVMVAALLILSVVVLKMFTGSSSSDTKAPVAVVHLPPLTTTPLRVFGPYSKEPQQPLLNENPQIVSFTYYDDEQQEAYLKKYGKTCYSDGNIVEKFRELPPQHAVELWKYCVLYLGHANLYMEPNNVAVLQSLELLSEQGSVTASDKEGLAHGAFLKIATAKSSVASKMMKLFITTPLDEVKKDAFIAQRWLFDAIIAASLEKQKEEWSMWDVTCRDLANSEGNNVDVVLELPLERTVEERLLQFMEGKNRATASSRLSPTHVKNPSCPVLGGYCCQVTDKSGVPTLLLRHPAFSVHEGMVPLPYAAHVAISGKQLDQLPFISTIRQTRTNQQPLASPSFFDILLQNDCLDATTVCHKCLKSTKTGSCDVCREACPCYCNALCKIRPPPKPVTKIWHVSPPIYRQDAERLVPRIVHQTWYEPVTSEKYPNMSRLIESWKQSGWEYNFYDDDMAAEFLSLHFPPEVRQAYDAINPGAFKADLFRYCVLLIRGGVYADMDVLLESNLDEAVAPDVGFMVPIDEPGIKVGHRSCLWNGFLAVAPGHVFLAKTIEMVVNNIRNRFTSVDYDDMLCPSPSLSVSHTVDTLFTCGPCILGAAINAVLGRHLQDEFEIGDVDLYKASDGKVFHPKDPRLKIPGRTVILQQNKQDMGAHRFTWVEKSLIVAATDMPDYDDRPPDKEHYSKTHEKVGIYGLKKLYKDSTRANEEIRIIV